MDKEKQAFEKIPGEAILLITAIIWGTGFVSQRKAMEGMQPFAFIALRFLMGCLVLLPLLIFHWRKGDHKDKSQAQKQRVLLDSILPSFACGLFLFLGTTFQQIGIVTTTAAKAGFITSLYLVLVPLLGIFMGKKVNLWVWLGVALALVGVYFLSVGIDANLQKGDLYLLVGALFWAFQILTVDHFSNKTDNLHLSFGQFAVTSLFGFAAVFFTESLPLIKNSSAILPLVYSGVVAVGIAFTLQVFGQRRVNPALASLIMGLEAVFAVIGGMAFLGERLTAREWLGCAIMLAAVLLVQLKGQQKKEQTAHEIV